MVRTTCNILLAVVAVALLGALVLLSTAPSDAQRRLDLALRHLNDVAQALDREVVAMRSLNIDGRERLAVLSEAMQVTLAHLATDLEQAYPEAPTPLQRMQGGMLEGFHSIGRSATPADPERLRRDFAVVRRQSERLREQVDRYAESYGAYRGLSDAASQASREYVRELRDRRLGDPADAIFRASQQVLQRTGRGGETDLQQVEAILARMKDEAALRAMDDRLRVAELADRFSELVTARSVLDASFDEATSVQLGRPLDALRDQINSDYLYRLATVNDSRVLLSVYTGLLLLVLAHFGFRLQRSYAALNESHAQLAAVNASLEGRVLQRTVDLESAYNELKESQVQLVQAEKMSSLGQLVAGVMHEINTPLLYVLNNQTTTADNIRELKAFIAQAVNVVELLRTPGASTEALKKELKLLRVSFELTSALEAMDEIEGLTQDNIEGLQQISELVQSLKDFSRLDRAGEDLFDVREGIEKTLTITHNLWKYGVDVVRDFGDVPKIPCAPSKINQVFMNLVTNAVQAMDGAGTLTLRTRSTGRWVEVEVEDTGCGVPADNIPKIMDPFFTTKPVGQGTGLGLSIVSKIVSEHGGTIDVRSEVGAGTTFTIRLPVRRESAAEAA
jgi:signal transduction histidine kinase